MERIVFPVDQCVLCGSIVAEGQWVCPGCQANCEEDLRRAKTSPVRKETPRKIRWFKRKRAKK